LFLLVIFITQNAVFAQSLNANKPNVIVILTDDQGSIDFISEQLN